MWRFAPLLMLLGCPKPSVVKAPQPEAMHIASVLQSATEGPVEADDTLAEALLELASERNLQPQTVAVPESRLHRLEKLTEGAGTGLVLLVESTARYSSQMVSRYRWTVEVEAMLVDGDDPSEVVEVKFSVPVHLLYAHQREKEALAEATPGIKRRVGNLLDDWIREHTL